MLTRWSLSKLFGRVECHLAGPRYFQTVEKFAETDPMHAKLGQGALIQLVYSVDSTSHLPLIATGQRVNGAP